MKSIAFRGLSAPDKRISDFLAGISRAGVRALMLDYDGTIAPFSTSIEHATPYSEVRPLLKRIKQETDTRVVIVTGRSASSAARLLDIPQIEIWGCHGLERLKVDGQLERPDMSEESLQAISEIAELLKSQGLESFSEHKFASIAVHWRGSEALAGHITRRVLRVWSAVQNRSGVSLLPFDGGIEITVGSRNKGDAVQTILSEIGRDSAVAYLGDDTTDEVAFGALRGHGLNILVREEYRRTLADVWIRPGNDVAAFLNSWILAYHERNQ